MMSGGNFVESLIKGNLITLLNDRGIKINGISKEHFKELAEKTMNLTSLLPMAMKLWLSRLKLHTGSYTLTEKKVDNFLKKLKVFKEIFTEYKDKTIYGAVAYLTCESGILDLIY